MNPGIIFKIILGTAISTHNANKAAELYETQTKPELERYYMSYFVGQILDQEERDWILENEVRPNIANLSPKEVKTILEGKAKNEKRLKKGKEAVFVLVSDEDIRRCHREYLNFKREQKREKERAVQEEIAKREQRRRAAELKRMYEANAEINGEDDSEVAAKFFG
ncbi:hypothetical protein IKG20_00975 [Candidatus Saccharibacteria bacterium]|nr:hypothetical protein [Candidatus Saccharibacteria bacterium]